MFLKITNFFSDPIPKLKEGISVENNLKKKNNNDKENDFTEEFFLHLSIFKNYLNQLVNLVAINWYVQLV